MASPFVEYFDEETGRILGSFLPGYKKNSPKKLLLKAVSIWLIYYLGALLRIVSEIKP